MSKKPNKADVETIRKRCGLTLVELLVVISTIGLLMGILLPVVNKAKRSAIRTYCQSNLRQIAIGFRSYLDDNSDIMPLACRYPWLNPDPNDPENKPAITKFLLPHLRQPEIFKCKGDIEQKYYERPGGTSYEYHSRLGGKPVSRSSLAISGVKERDIPVLNDFDPYHGKPGRPGSKNYLYADGHIGDFRKQ